MFTFWKSFLGWSRVSFTCLDFGTDAGPSWPWSYGSWIYNYLCNQCPSPLMMWVWLPLRMRCTTLCDKVCQWLATGRWFSPCTPVSSTNKTDRHDITGILLKVALNTIKPNLTSTEAIFRKGEVEGYWATHIIFHSFVFCEGIIDESRRLFWKFWRVPPLCISMSRINTSFVNDKQVTYKHWFNVNIFFITERSDQDRTKVKTGRKKQIKKNCWGRRTENKR